MHELLLYIYFNIFNNHNMYRVETIKSFAHGMIFLEIIIKY